LGHYAFIKNNNALGKGELARLKSPTVSSFSTNDDRCFEFYFFAVGANTINVYKVYPSNNTNILVWALNSQFGDIWTRATIPFNLTEPFHFIIEGCGNIFLYFFKTLKSFDFFKGTSASQSNGYLVIII
jgi:hypothetical protein